MNRIPPSLLYLTIYNPSLHATGPVSDDDEDAEEQAHILFYTSKERAVSRDRMLRQIGLAKALVSFSDMFNPEDQCDNVHSQSKRMIMVSPEPDFWIHACIEVAKAPVDKGKSKGRDKPKPPEKGKEKEPQPLTYDYLDGSVLDVAIRAELIRGYERFKLIHGSFTSILSNLGQQALELQLERFFTVWAWSWNFEDGHEFGKHLGTPLHPLARSLIPLLDTFSSQLPDEISLILLSPPFAIPSTRFTNSQHPLSLSQHLLSLIPSESMHAHQKSDDPPVTDVSNDIRTSDANAPNQNEPNSGSEPGAFFGIPSTANLDVRKWNWSGYLTFGRKAGKISSDSLVEANKEIRLPEDKPDPLTTRTSHVEVDKSALDDAISSNHATVSVPTTSINETSSSQLSDVARSHTPGDVTTVTDGQAGPVDSKDSTSADSPINTPIDSAIVSPVDGLDFTPQIINPDFLVANLFLPEPTNPVATHRRKIYHHTNYPLLLALVDSDSTESLDLSNLARPVKKLFEDIKDTMKSGSQSVLDGIPSATKILQPVDRHIVRSAQFTVPSSSFASKSSHLYNIQALQNMNSDISEVFSRGQNPQHWHIARRGLGTANDGAVIEGEVYMEVFRKEASLTDVDNELSGIVRRFETVDVVQSNPN